MYCDFADMMYIFIIKKVSNTHSIRLGYLPFWFLVFFHGTTSLLSDTSVKYQEGAARSFFHEAIRRFSGDI